MISPAPSSCTPSAAGWRWRPSFASVPRLGRYPADGSGGAGFPPSSIPWLALGSWLLCVGWFGFNVMSAQSLNVASGLVAMNSLMAMVGGILAALIVGQNDPGFVHNGALAGLVAVCAGSDVMHPAGAFLVGAVAGVIFVKGFEICQFRLKIDDVLGVWPLHGLCGLWGGVAAGIFGLKALGGLGGVAFAAQLVGSLAGVGLAFAGRLAGLFPARSGPWPAPLAGRRAPRRRPLDPQDQRQPGVRHHRMKSARIAYFLLIQPPSVRGSYRGKGPKAVEIQTFPAMTIYGTAIATSSGTAASAAQFLCNG